MARPGPQPKSVKHGHGGAGWIDVPNVPYDGPGSDTELPHTPGVTWFPQVEGWWEITRTMPHCILWEPSDWLFAIHTAYMLNSYWGEYFGGSATATMSTEIRRREDQMGTTMEARRKLGIRYVDPAVQVQSEEDEDEQTPDGEGQAGVRPIGSAKSRRQQLAG